MNAEASHSNKKGVEMFSDGSPVREVVSTEKAPAAVGPYSQAIGWGQLVFTAGQIGLDPQTGSMVEGGLEAETERVLDNLEAVLEEAGTALDRVLKTTIFLLDMQDFAAVNAIYAKRFSGRPPARSTVAVSALPLGARVEIEVIASR